MFKKLFGRGESKDPEQIAREQEWRRTAPFDADGEGWVVTGAYAESAFPGGVFPDAARRVLVERGRANGFEAILMRVWIPTVSRKKSKKQQAAAQDSILEAVFGLNGWVAFAGREAGVLRGKEVLGKVSAYEERDQIIEGEAPAEGGGVDLGGRHDRVDRLFLFPIVIPGEEETELTPRARDFNIQRGEQYEAELDQEPHSVQSKDDIASANEDWLQRFEAMLDQRRVSEAERKRVLWYLREIDERELRKNERGSFERLGVGAVVDGYLAGEFKPHQCRSRRDMQSAIDALARLYKFIAESTEGATSERAASVVRGLTKAQRRLIAGLR